MMPSSEGKRKDDQATEDFAISRSPKLAARKEFTFQDSLCYLF